MPTPSNRTRCHAPHARQTPPPRSRARRVDSVIQQRSSSSSSSSASYSALDDVQDVDIDSDDEDVDVVGDPATPTPAARRVVKADVNTNARRNATTASRRDKPRAPEDRDGSAAASASATVTPATQRADTAPAPASANSLRQTSTSTSPSPSYPSSPPYTIGLREIDAATASPPRAHLIPHTRSPPRERARWFNHPDRYDWFKEEDGRRPACVDPQEVLVDVWSDAGAADAALAEAERNGRAGDAVARQQERELAMRMLEEGEGGEAAWIAPAQVRDEARSIGVEQEAVARLRGLPEMQCDVLVYWRSSATLVFRRRLEVFANAPQMLYRIELRNHPVLGRRMLFYFPIGHAHTYDGTDGYKKCGRCTEAGLEEATRVAKLVLQRRLVGNVAEIFCAEPIPVEEAVQQKCG